MDNANMDALSGRAGQLIDAVTGAIMNTVEVAAEKLALAAEVARVQTRMAAFGAVLESIGAQKDALAQRMEGASGPTRLLYQRQVDALTAQELAVLEKAGVPSNTAQQALAVADTKPVYQRQGRRFARRDALPNGVHGE